MKVSAVVLAAGKSERMGENKLLLEIGGYTTLDLLLNALKNSRIDEILVVLGHRSNELRPIVESHGIQEVFNPDYELGMASSFKAGLKKVSGDAVFLCLGDQPILNPEMLDKMISVMMDNPKTWIVSPVHKGLKGHPVLFKNNLFQEILSLGPTAQLKDVIIRNEDRHIEIQGDIWCTLDVDTPEDFGKIKEIIERFSV